MKTAICAIIKNEHRFLKEWLDWHLGLGFDAIHLFEDKGSDSHEEITSQYDNVYLRRYADDAEVRELLSAQGSSHRQVVLYSWFAEKFRDTYEWAAFIDIDEFVTLAEGWSLNRLCEAFKEYPAVHLSWRMKGASGHISRPECGVVEAYTEDGEFVEQDTGWRVKTFAHLNKFKGMRTLHYAMGGVNVYGEPSTDSIIYDVAWLNHYFTKSWEDWCDRIFDRGGTLNGHRTLAQFFEANPSMEHLRDELIASVADRIPNGTYWLDRKRGLIAGGNVGRIKSLNNERAKRDIR